jgi:hypothetical protein
MGYVCTAGPWQFLLTGPHIRLTMTVVIDIAMIETPAAWRGGSRA